MAIDERSRHQLFNHLDEVLGPEDAATLIEHLPPVGWADVATKRDLDALELRLDHRFESVDHRFESVDRRFESVDERFQAIDRRFDQVDQRFDQVDQRFDQVDQRFDQLARSFDQRFDEHAESVEERFGLRLEALEHKLVGMFHRELNAQTKLILFGMISIVVTMASLAFALARFT